MTATPKSDNAADGGSSPVACSVSYIFEGEYRSAPGRWGMIERRSELKTALGDEADYRSWISESGWRDFRIVKVTTTREILPQNADVDLPPRTSPQNKQDASGG